MYKKLYALVIPVLLLMSTAFFAQAANPDPGFVPSTSEANATVDNVNQFDLLTSPTVTFAVDTTRGTTKEDAVFVSSASPDLNRANLTLTVASDHTLAWEVGWQYKSI